MITDFGLAKDVESKSGMTRSGSTLGTPHYMPPEQAEGRVLEIDARSDVYSLGATLYEMLTLRPPFEGATVVEVLRQVVAAEPAPARRRNPLVGRDLDTICLKCLEKNPFRRYPSARDLAADLDRYLRGEPIVARPASSLEKFLRRVRRHPALSASLAALALVLVAGGIGAVLALRSTGEERERRARAEQDRASAEAGKEKAEAGKEKAEETLAKAGKVTRVIMGAYARLSPVHASLKRAFYEGRGREDRVARWNEEKDRIAEFSESVPRDPTSQAALQAVLGWLHILGGQQEEGSALFEKAKASDPEVAWSYLFEAMTSLQAYLAKQVLPVIHFTNNGVVFDEREGESRELARHREDFEKLLLQASKSGLWGEASAEIGPVLQGLREMHGGDLGKAEEALGRALALPELAWLEDEFRLARAKVRHLAKNFEKALEDLRHLVARMPERAYLHYFLALVISAKSNEEKGIRFREAAAFDEVEKALLRAVELEPRDSFSLVMLGSIYNERAGTGQARAPERKLWLERGLRAYERALSLDPEAKEARAGSSLILAKLAQIEFASGGDSETLCRRALALAEGLPRGTRLDTDRAPCLSTAYMILAKKAELEGGDGEPLFRAALEVWEGDGPGQLYEAFWAEEKSEAYLTYGMWRDERHRSPLEAVEAALKGAEVLARLEPDLVSSHRIAAPARTLESSWLLRQNQDPEPAWKAAEKEIESWLRIKPKDPQAWFLKTQVSFQRSEKLTAQGSNPERLLEEGLDQIGQALAEKPDDPEYLTKRGILLMRLGEALARRGADPGKHYDRSIADFRRAVEEKPADSVMQGSLGTALFRKGESLQARGLACRETLLEAVDLLARALAKDRDNGLGRLNLGNALAYLGTEDLKEKRDPLPALDRAIEALDRALELLPGDARVLNSRGNARRIKGMWRIAAGGDWQAVFVEAEADFVAALAARPAYGSALFNRAELYAARAEEARKSGEDPAPLFEKAEKDYEAAAQSSNLVLANLRCGRMTMTWGLHAASRGEDPRPLFGKAGERFAAVLEASPGQGRVYEDLGWLLSFLERFDEALSVLEQAAELPGGGSQQLRDTIARTKFFLDGPEWVRHWVSGDIRLRLGWFDGAVEAFEKAGALAGTAATGDAPALRRNLPNMYYNLACLHAMASRGVHAPGASPREIPAAEAEGLVKKGLEDLEKAVEAGYDKVESLREDSDLAPLRERPEFRALMEKLERK